MNGSTRIPVLSLEEEYALLKKVHESGDEQAIYELVIHNIRFVQYVSQDYLWSKLPKEDITHEGIIGLIKAIKHFDISKENRLITYAVHWIRSEIREYMIRNMNMVKIATIRTQRKLVFNSHRFNKRGDWFNKEEAKDVADKLNVPESEVSETEGRMFNSDWSYDHGPSNYDTDEGVQAQSLTPAEYLYKQGDDPAVIIEKMDDDNTGVDSLERGLALLDDRRRAIITKRYLTIPKVGLKELSEEHGISLERVRQLEADSLKKLSTLMEA